MAGGDSFETFVCCVGLGREGMYTKGSLYGRNPSGSVAVYAAFSWGFGYLRKAGIYNGTYDLDSLSAGTSVIPGGTATLLGMTAATPPPLPTTLRAGPWSTGAPSAEELSNLKAALTAKLG